MTGYGGFFFNEWSCASLICTKFSYRNWYVQPIPPACILTLLRVVLIVEMLVEEYSILMSD